MAMITEKMMRDRLVVNREEFKKTQELSAPLRAKRDKLADQIRPIEDAIRDLNREIRKVEAPLFELDMERGRITRALPGNRSVPAVEVGLVGEEPASAQKGNDTK